MNNDIKQGDTVNTPRFLRVKITEVIQDNRYMEKSRELGYTEPTHYTYALAHNPRYDILGKHTGLNTMVFAAVEVVK